MTNPQHNAVPHVSDIQWVAKVLAESEGRNPQSIDMLIGALTAGAGPYRAPNSLRVGPQTQFWGAPPAPFERGPAPWRGRSTSRGRQPKQGNPAKPGGRLSNLDKLPDPFKRVGLSGPSAPLPGAGVVTAPMDTSDGTSGVTPGPPPQKTKGLNPLLDRPEKPVKDTSKKGPTIKAPHNEDTRIKLLKEALGKLYAFRTGVEYFHRRTVADTPGVPIELDAYVESVGFKPAYDQATVMIGEALSALTAFKRLLGISDVRVVKGSTDHRVNPEIWDAYPIDEIKSRIVSYVDLINGFLQGSDENKSILGAGLTCQTDAKHQPKGTSSKRRKSTSRK